MEARYAETHGGPTGAAWLQSEYAGYAAGDPLWKTPVVDPGKADIFSNTIYTRGGMTLQALRNRIGDPAFWTLLKTWLSTRAGGNGSSEQFEALAAQVSGQDLTGFFQAWLRDKAKPAKTPDNGL